MSHLNFKHLRYFWTVAKAGGIGLASKRLHLTPQTISGQITLFEHVLGYPLFNRVGRHLELTDAGRMVLSYADEIFTLGEELEGVVRNPSGGRPLQLRVGIADAVPKVVAYGILEPATRSPNPLHTICREGKLSALLADLAVHRLDIVIADAPMSADINVKGFNHLLGECGITFFATAKLARAHKGTFPACLNQAPLLLPGEDAAVRPRIMRWLDLKNLHPKIVGEFDDSALQYAFGRAGAGIFAAPSVIATQVQQQYDVVPIGRTPIVTEHFYAISVERRLTHPAVMAITLAARKKLFRRRSTDPQTGLRS